VKTDNTHAKQFAALVKEWKRKFKSTPQPQHDPITQLIMGFLEWNATRKLAEQGYEKLMSVMVDTNDLRVSHSHELAAILGPDYPQVEQRTTRLREALQDIYLREHAVSLDSLADRPKKEVRAYLESLGGIPQYVAAQVLLLCFGGHAIPVDDKMAALLVEEGAVPAGGSVHDIAAFLERQVKAGEAVALHHLMRAWADSKRRKDLTAQPARTRKSTTTTTAKAGTTTKKKITKKK